MDPMKPYRDNQTRYHEAKLAEVFEGLGMSKSAAKVAAGGRDGGSGLDPMPPAHVREIDRMYNRIDQLADEKPAKLWPVPDPSPAQARERALSGNGTGGRVDAKAADRLEQELVKVFQGLGLSESASKIAASGR